MSQSRGDQLRTIMDAKTDTGVGTTILVADYRHLVVSITPTAATATVKCAGSIANAEPNFAGAVSATNEHDFIEMVDLEDQSNIIDGDTGVVFAGAITESRMFEVNTNGLKWLTFNTTAISAGDLTIRIRPFKNN